MVYFMQLGISKAVGNGYKKVENKAFEERLSLWHHRPIYIDMIRFLEKGEGRGWTGGLAGKIEGKGESGRGIYTCQLMVPIMANMH